MPGRRGATRRSWEWLLALGSRHSPRHATRRSPQGRSRKPVKPIRRYRESPIRVPERRECDGLHNVSAQSLLPRDKADAIANLFDTAASINVGSIFAGIAQLVRAADL